MLRKFTFAIAIGASLTACDRAPKHTYEEYMASDDLRLSVATECQKMSVTEREADKDCALAVAAMLASANSGTEYVPPPKPFGKKQ